LGGSLVGMTALKNVTKAYIR